MILLWVFSYMKRLPSYLSFVDYKYNYVLEIILIQNISNWCANIRAIDVRMLNKNELPHSVHWLSV